MEIHSSPTTRASFFYTFKHGTYQGGTNRKVDSINVYNEEKNRLAIFKQSTGEFITFCEPNGDEHDELLETGNFGGQLEWFSGQAKNLPPRSDLESEQNIEDQTTLINSFESDVTEITPLDSSSSDYQI